MKWTVAGMTVGYVSFQNVMGSMSEVGLLVLWGTALLVVAGSVRRASQRREQPVLAEVRQAPVRAQSQELKVSA